MPREDGLGGICDRDQFICFALALWNGKDPILKERMFGVTGTEGNHGEDVKDYTGRGCGASHQTGWTGLIAELMIVAAETFPGLAGEHLGDPAIH